MKKEMIMTVVHRKEVTVLQRAIQHIDPKAFTMILNAQEIMGQGFKRMDWDDVNEKKPKAEKSDK